MEFPRFCSVLRLLVLDRRFPDRKSGIHVLGALRTFPLILHDARTSCCGDVTECRDRSPALHVLLLVCGHLVRVLSAPLPTAMTDLRFSNGVLQPFSQLGWWRWMYRLSPFTYLIEGLLGQGQYFICFLESADLKPYTSGVLSDWRL